MLGLRDSRLEAFSSHGLGELCLALGAECRWGLAVCVEGDVCSNISWWYSMAWFGGATRIFDFLWDFGGAACWVCLRLLQDTETQTSTSLLHNLDRGQSFQSTGSRSP